MLKMDCTIKTLPNDVHMNVTWHFPHMLSYGDDNIILLKMPMNMWIINENEINRRWRRKLINPRSN